MSISRGRSRPVQAFRTVRDVARTQLWPIPTLGVFAALALGIALPRVDAAYEMRLSGHTSYLFSGGAGSARSVLEAVSGSLITVTSLTFSLTVVTLQLASSQFSPRLLRTFTRDLVVQGTLALFLGTFTYALTVLRTVRTADAGREEFVPSISVTVGFALALASVVGLVFFLAHLTRTIRVESMLHSVHENALRTARTQLDESTGPPFLLTSLPALLWTPLTATTSGFVVGVDAEALLRAAVEADALVLLECPPGRSIVAGVPIGGAARAHPGRPLDADTCRDLGDAVQESVRTGFERTSAEDVALGLRQLTDVAVRALSPGVNDPTTAVHALSHSSALLSELATLELGPRVLRDDDGAIRVVLVLPDLADLLDLAVRQPAHYASGEPTVLERLFGLLEELAWTCRPHQRAVVASQAERLRRVTAASALDREDRAALDTAALRVEAALGGEWRPAHTRS